MFYLLRKTTVIEWLVFAFGTFLCFFPNLATDLAGIAVIALVWFWQRYDLKRKEAVAATRRDRYRRCAGKVQAGGFAWTKQRF
ncbi:MAG: hypothetical protein R2851_08090 [Caldilineaceae bacterium]